MNNKLNKFFKMLAGGATILAYGSFYDNYKNQQSAIDHKDQLHKHINSLQNQISNLEKQIPISYSGEGVNKTNQIMSKVNELNSELNNLKKIHNQYISHFENGSINKEPQSSLNIYNKYKEEIDYTFNKVKNKANEIVDALNNITNKFMDDNTISRFINEYKNYLASLNNIEICLLINITTSLFILTCVISILLSLFGNYLIDKLSLEKRFPRLTKFINLRVTLQKYYILTNLIFIIIAILPLILVNFITLIGN